MIWYIYILSWGFKVSGWVPCGCHSRTVNHFCASVSIDTSWVPDEGGCPCAFFFWGDFSTTLGPRVHREEMGNIRSICGCGMCHQDVGLWRGCSAQSLVTCARNDWGWQLWFFSLWFVAHGLYSSVWSMLEVHTRQYSMFCMRYDGIACSR